MTLRMAAESSRQQFGRSIFLEYLLSLKLGTPPWSELFSNELRHPKLTISTLTHIHWVQFVEIGVWSFSPFCDFRCLSLKNLLFTLYLENLDEVQRCSELFHRDNLCHHVCQIFFVLIFTKSITLSFTTHWHILWYVTSMCFARLWYMYSLVRWIALWLFQWTWAESWTMPNVSTNSLDHKAFLDASTATMYSASIVEELPCLAIPSSN